MTVFDLKLPLLTFVCELNIEAAGYVLADFVELYRRSKRVFAVRGL
jgi:hypothetical protein